MTIHEATSRLHYGQQEKWHSLHWRHIDPPRVWQHREGVADGFTKRYGCKILVWYELADTMEGAITREKQAKAGSRAKKLALIEAMNPDWRDLFDDIAG